jgi:hypothetical protein
MKLVDFSELVLKQQQDKEKFWDWLDEELSNVREQYKDKEEADQKESISM